MTKKERPARQTPEELRESIKNLIGEVEVYVAPIEVQLIQFRAKITSWKNSISDATLDAKVALHTDDDRLLRAAEARLKRAINAVDFLEAELDAISQADGEGDSDEPVEESVV